MAASCRSNPNLGVPGVMHSLASEFRKAGHEVRFRFRDQPGRVGEMLFGWRLAQSADAKWADLVDSHAVDAWPLCAKSVRPAVVARSHGLELVVHRRLVNAKRQGKAVVSPIYRAYRGSARLWFEKQAIRHCDASFILNQSDLDICRTEYLAGENRLHLLPNGFPGEFARSPLENLPDPGIAFVGSWLSRKGNDLAVTCLTHVLRARPDTRVLIAGTGIPSSQVLSDFPEDLRKALDVREQFTRDQLPNLLRDSGILLFPSRSEGYPLSLVEAMACGLAPVATGIPGVVDVIRDEVNGCLVPPEDTQTLQNRILALLDQPLRLAQLRWQARESVRATSWDKLAVRQLAIYDQLLSNRNPGNRTAKRHT